MNMPTITGELRKWRRHEHQSNGVETMGESETPHALAIHGYVYNSEIWDDGEEATLIGYLTEHGGFYLLVVGRQLYRLPKDEERK